jgi:hypothetical protein
LNVSTFGLIEEEAMRGTRDKAIHISIVLATIVAWLSISNHCALGAVGGPKAEVAHASCHGSPVAPSDTPTKGESSPCCKNLRATLATLPKVPTIGEIAGFNFDAYFARPFSFLNEFRVYRPLELDTGPPEAPTFAESVLQRSILAHAPPVSLS